MKLLLDECVPSDLRHSLPGHEVHSVRWVGFAGKRNGELLAAAEASGYEVLLTVDRSFPYQNRIAGRAIAVLVVKVKNDTLEELVASASSISRALALIGPGEVLEID